MSSMARLDGSRASTLITRNRGCSILMKVFIVACLMISCFFLAAKNHELLPILSPPNHRRLDWSSDCPPDIISSLPYPALPTTPILKKPTYLAAFPGSGDKIFSKYFIEMITGLHVGEAAVSPSLFKMQELGGSAEYPGQGEVVGVRTHFPHTSGKLASWDTDITRTIVFLRNPLHAIPSYFNEVYELRNHLPPGSSRDIQYQEDTHNTWIKWRDNQFPSQMMLYRRFVSFWMERHIDHDNLRIFFTYEDLVEWYKGPEESKRLFNFLKEGLRENVLEMVKSGALMGVTADDKDAIDLLVTDATKNMVQESDVPCIWNELVAPASPAQNRRLQSIDPPYSSSSGGEWDPVERPLSPENLAALSQMLLELMNRWSRNQRLLSIIAGYHRDVNKLYLKVAEQWEEQQGQQQVAIAQDARGNLLDEQVPENASSGEGESISQANRAEKNFHIIQASSPHTSSTIATNWLMGLFEPFSDYAFMSGTWPQSPIKQSGKDVSIEAHIVTKTHDLEILEMYKRIRPLFDELFFVISYKESDLGVTLKEELCEYKNVLCIPFEELVFSDKEELKEMVKILTGKLKSRFQYFFGTSEWLSEKDELNCFRRLEDMARAKVDMAEQPVEMMDIKFGVHGGGKKGKKKCPPNLAIC